MLNEKQKKYSKYALLALLLLLISGMALVINNLQGQLSLEKNNTDALSADMVKYRDKWGSEISEKQLILGTYKSLQAIHASDSSTIGQLQKLVNKTTLSATIIKNTTSGILTGTTNVTFGNKPDSLTKLTDPCDGLFPTYQAEIKDSSYVESKKRFIVWSSFSILSNKDSTHIDYKINNELDITQEYKKEGAWPFRRKVPIVKIKNLNPHTQTNEIASYVTQVPKTGKKTAIIAGFSLALGIIAGIFIAK
jgi:hypothetical protein